MNTSFSRNPYIVGGWVTGRRFYGHTLLRQNLLDSPDTYLWVIGTRRVGKTSLLRQLSHDADPEFIPIYWNMEGCDTIDSLSDELFYAIEERDDQLASLGLDIASLDGKTARVLLRLICRAAEEHDRSILLLIDEPEVLIAIAQNEDSEVQRLRAAIQRPSNLRVIMASTTVLSQLDVNTRHWPTSSFLAGFAPRHLAGLSESEAEGLIRQVNANKRVQVSPKIITAILGHTNNHPYLTQWLCYRLYQDDGSLRTPAEADITLDTMLDSLFQLTYKHLSPTERHILLDLLRSGATSTESLAQSMQLSIPEARIYLYALTRLGYTRRDGSSHQTVIGNSFFKSWLETNAEKLRLDDAEISDASIQELALTGYSEEQAYWYEKLQIHKQSVARLEVQAASYGQFAPTALLNEIDFHQHNIRELEARLDALHT